ncbi:MAG TPA: tetratricopeptide repeat protein [Anaeromyxobacteraceae bacterium]|nr:tetratricopeptide repeat protein [Anaeromyxobacteraceae bacterium]
MPAQAVKPSLPADVAPLLARFDEVWTSRDRPESLAAARTALDEAKKLAPDAYEVLWREARYLAWMSDDTSLPTKERSKLGKEGWDIAERAVKLEPDRIEGQFYAAANMGNYALGIGVLKALTQGIEGKFKERLSRAEEIDPTFDWGTIYNAWGRFWYELPWPKYSAKRSEEALRKALRVNPASARARVYLADLFIKEGKREQAKNLLNDVISTDVAGYDPPEVRRMQARARETLEKLR